MKFHFPIWCIVLLLAGIDTCAQDTARADQYKKNAKIVFLLDVSNSMGRENKMQLLKKSTEELLKLLDKQDQISLLSFGSQVNTLYSTTAYSGPDSLLKIISKVRSTASSTNINGAIYDAYYILLQKTKKEIRSKNFNPAATAKHVLLVTDGLFELNPYTKQLVCDNPDIELTCVIVGRGLEADKAVTYVREELQLRVITLVDEERDVKKLAELFGSR
ncbi:MAG TPA: vWA domain-containing protein [Chitinophagaceae bacterium]|nr:vWA domain-containing protein [Chitinophagaceae bacterium]